jgi:hypothetical protein
MALHPAGPKNFFRGEKIFLIFCNDAIFISFEEKCQGKIISRGILIDSGWRVSYIHPQGRDFYGLSHSVTLWGFEAALPEIPPALPFLKGGELFRNSMKNFPAFSPFGKGGGRGILPLFK